MPGALGGHGDRVSDRGAEELWEPTILSYVYVSPSYFLTRHSKGTGTDFSCGFLRKVSGFMNCKLNVPGFSFPKKNSILLVLNLAEKKSMFSRRELCELFHSVCVFQSSP